MREADYLPFQFDGFTEGLRAVTGIKRCIDDIVVLAGFRDRAGSRIERCLMRRAIEHAGIAPEDVLRAVAVVDIPIEDRDAPGAVPLLRMTRGNRRVVEEAEAHGSHPFGMMPRRAHCDEGVRDMA